MDYFERQVVVQYNLVYRANLFVIRLVTKNRLSSNRVIYMMMKLSLSRTANTKKYSMSVFWNVIRFQQLKKFILFAETCFFMLLTCLLIFVFLLDHLVFIRLWKITSIRDLFYSVPRPFCVRTWTLSLHPYIAHIQNRTKSQLSLLKYSRKTNHATGMYCSKAFNWVARHFFPYIECQNHNC